jgi:uncharacterized protein (UPF0212 family)
MILKYAVAALKGDFRKMILNFKGETTLESLLVDKGITNVVRCGQCSNLVAFDDNDISYVAVNESAEKGFVKCPWCGHSMYVAEVRNTAFGRLMSRKYFTTIEGEEFEEKLACFQQANNGRMV